MTQLIKSIGEVYLSEIKLLSYLQLRILSGNDFLPEHKRYSMLQFPARKIRIGCCDNGGQFLTKFCIFNCMSL